MSNLGNKTILSKNLKRYIEQSGKDRRELAEIWGFPYSTVTEWINGRKYPRIDRIKIMADYFGILKTYLIENKKKKPTEYDGVSDNRKALIDFAKSVPEDKAAMILKVIRSIVEGD